MRSRRRKTIDIDLDGAKVAPTAKLITLSGKSTQATNSIDDPKALMPVDSTMPAEPKIHHTMPAYSIQVIEFTEQ